MEWCTYACTRGTSSITFFCLKFTFFIIASFSPCFHKLIQCEYRRGKGDDGRGKRERKGKGKWTGKGLGCTYMRGSSSLTILFMTACLAFALFACLPYKYILLFIFVMMYICTMDMLMCVVLRCVALRIMSVSVMSVCSVLQHVMPWCVCMYVLVFHYGLCARVILVLACALPFIWVWIWFLSVVVGRLRLKFMCMFMR